VALFLLVVTGARRGELCGLKWSDVDVEHSSINIERQYLPGGGGLYIAPLKSETGAEDGARTVHVGQPTIALLERYGELQRALTGREPDGWLISYDGGVTPMNPKTLAALISSLAKRSGLDGVTTHTFRKVTATQLIASGADVDSAARRMGHTTQVMFGTYVKGADDRAVAAAEALEARLIDQGLPIAELLAGT
jgi:integrase